MNILIPCGGIGERFAKEGYLEPKPLISAMGQPILVWLLQNLHLGPNDTVTIAYHQDLEKWRLQDKLRKALETQNINIVHLSKPTRGAAETVAIALRSISPAERQRKTMLLDCDTFYKNDVVGAFRKCDMNMTVVFRDDTTCEPPIYSYCDVDSSHKVRGIQEKQRISRWANSGCYCFADGSTLLSYCERAMEITQPVKGEFYISSVIATMLADGYPWKALPIPEKDVVCLGTPLQLRLFCASSPAFAPRRICFDLDGTLVTHPSTPGDYSTVQPYPETIEYARYLKSIGNFIIIQTARGMLSCGGNLGLILANAASSVYEILEKFDIPCDELYFGKPMAHFYVDDLAHNVCLDIPKAVGFYQTDVDTRKHNHIAPSTLLTIIKTSTQPLDGEIHWYLHAPPPVKHLIPAFIRASPDHTWYEVEKLEATTSSYLFVNESLTPQTFLQILQHLQTIHSSSPVPDHLDIHENYVPKLESRFAAYDYSPFQESNDMFKILKKNLENHRGRPGVIHGDPVLSNILVIRGGGIKFVDMRGKLGEKCSIFGDVYYDFAKIYQSLVGYDEILLGKNISETYRSLLLDIFQDFIHKTFGPTAMEAIKVITGSLFFTLIPLHDNEKCPLYMAKCKELLG